MPYRVLTFNWHEAYLSMLAATGHRFDVVQRTKAGLPFWLYGTRPVPENVELVHADDARLRLESQRYDVVVCHTLFDCLEVSSFDVPRVLVFHNLRETELALARAQGSSHLAERTEDLPALLGSVHPVFISESKRKSWGLSGDVVLPGVDLDQFRGHSGERLAVLRVGNFLLERDLMLGGKLQEQVLRGIPHSTLGLNPGIRGSFLSPSFDFLLEAYRSHRVYLHTSREDFEDGYNLALLEAMATGMPVVSLRHRTAPVIEGESAVVADSAPELRQGVLSLLEDGKKARRYGDRNREIVAAKFPMEPFVRGWQDVLETTARRARLRPARRRAAERRLHVLYVRTVDAPPALHLERAFRRRHVVVSAGFPGLRSPDLPFDHPVLVRELLEALPLGFRPDLVFWVASGKQPLPADFGEGSLKTFAYLLEPEAGLFAGSSSELHAPHPADVDALHERGARGHLLPFACDPEIHRSGNGDRPIDVVFAGASPGIARTSRAWSDLSKRFRAHLPEDPGDEEAVLDAFRRARIAWVPVQARRLEWQLFAAVASGCALFVEPSADEEIGRLLSTLPHVTGRGDVPLDVEVQSLLREPWRLESLAAEARSRALVFHTYDRRVEAIESRWLSSPAAQPTNASSGSSARPRVETSP